VLALRRVGSVSGFLRLVLACACIWLGGIAAVGSEPTAPSVAWIAGPLPRSAAVLRRCAKQAHEQCASLLPPPPSPATADHTREPAGANPVRVLVPDLYLRQRVLLI
jgi:hypothetical protein